MRIKFFVNFLIVFCLTIAPSVPGYSQKVGVVLSGGGAAGFSHIGVLKALEEKGIPIDFITGTSAGALVGAMYACGYSPAEIETYVLSDVFQLMSNGKLEWNQQFLFQKDYNDASLIDFAFSKDSILKKSLPTNFIKPSLLDFEMMRIFGLTSASYGDNFDNLFVPFRCVASNIVKKESVIFKNGKLNQAVRASITYPFFINPIRVDGALLFDGGLYNNFPSDVMYSNFDPDYIIGSNVSGNANLPSEDDLISQLTNMLVSHTNFELPCDDGIIIYPKTDVKTFGFSEVKNAINDGYNSTIKYLDSIEKHVTKRVSIAELTEKRVAFKKRILPLQLSSINVTSPKKKSDISFIRQSILKNNRKETIDFSLLKKRYFRTNAIPHLEYLFPTLDLNKDSTFTMNFKVRKAKDFKVEVGGHFSSRPINMGYIGLTYYNLSKIALRTKAESYFGKFYASIKTEVEIQFPFYYPISITPYFVQNRWDYFRSSTSFFEDIKPSFLLQKEIYAGLKFKMPIGNAIKSTVDYRLFELKDQYYQTPNFLSIDTADFTRFSGQTISWEFEQNTLNRKQFANGGHQLSFKVRYVNGKERSKSGSTSNQKIDLFKYHNWLHLETNLQSFVIDKAHFHWGLHFKGVLSTQKLFSNYKASILSSPAFDPFPDVNTLFLDQYRAPIHTGAGTNIIFTLRKNWDIRIDAYWYQPIKKILLNDDGSFSYAKPFKGESYLASGSLIFNSPIGPVRLTLNYFPEMKKPVMFQFSYGYILFNERAIR